MRSSLDAVVFRLQNFPSWNLYQIHPDGQAKPWFEVTPGIISDLVIRESDLQTQVEALPAQIMFWGRMVAQARRVWEIEERLYRVWRDSLAIQILDNWSGGKRPTKDQLDQLIRAHENYPGFYQRIERAEEAMNAAEAVLDGFRAKKDLMKVAVIRRHEDGAPQISV